MSHDVDRDRTGKVLTFRTPATRPRSSGKAEAGARGTILFFTGVRYERPRDVFARPLERPDAFGDQQLRS